MKLNESERKNSRFGDSGMQNFSCIWKTSLVFGRSKKSHFKGKRVEICKYNTIYMHIDIKVIFDPSTLSYMENETKKE